MIPPPLQAAEYPDRSGVDEEHKAGARTSVIDAVRFGKLVVKMDCRAIPSRRNGLLNLVERKGNYRWHKAAPKVDDGG